ncbi:MAG: hypothetical protein MUO64_15345 [Anaerolineales bacterium]|nr:hypothetical protein [Anaerolineales bacterium]
MKKKTTQYLVKRVAKALKEEKDQYWTTDHLPWRKNRTPYRTFIAEFLLVRTRTDLVERLFGIFITKYPDINVLANSDLDELSGDLRSLGLKKRVPLILQAAKFVVKEFNGEIPYEIDKLLSIPGIGLYTATAIAAFSFDSPEVPADVNILRFLSRLTGISMEHPTKGSSELRALLPYLSKADGGPKPEDLLDFTRQICCPRKPKCQTCILNKNCHYYHGHLSA